MSHYKAHRHNHLDFFIYRTSVKPINLLAPAFVPCDDYRTRSPERLFVGPNLERVFPGFTACLPAEHELVLGLTSNH